MSFCARVEAAKVIITDAQWMYVYSIQQIIILISLFLYYLCFFIVIFCVSPIKVSVIDAAGDG